MEKDVEASDFLIQYNDSLENFNIGQEILISDDNDAEPNEYVCEGNNSGNDVTIPNPVYNENQEPGLFDDLPGASEFVPISVTPIHVQEIPKMFINNDIHQKLTQALDAGAAHSDANNEEYDSNVGTNVVPNEIVVTDEQYGLLKDKGWMLLEIKGYTRKVKQEPISDSDNEPPRSSMDFDVKPVTKRANTNTVPKTKTCRHMDDMEQVKKKKKKPGHGIKMFNPTKTTKYGIKPGDSTGAGFPSGSGNGPRETFIKCPYELKDIPKEIVLGKTTNGKKLVARVLHVNPKNTTTGNKDGNTNV